MIERIEQFFKSNKYLLSISIVTFLLWFINIDSVGPKPSFDILEIIGISVFALVISLSLVLFKETIYTFPPLIMSIIMLSNQNMGMTTLNELWIFYIVLVIVIASFIYHMVHFKVKFKLGALGIGLLIVSLAYLLSLSGYFLDQKPFEFSVIFISLMGLIYFLIYAFFRNTSSHTNIQYIFKVFYYLTFIIILQTFVMITFYFIDNAHLGSFTDLLKLGIEERWGYIKDGFFVRLNVGWGLGNNIGGVLAYLLPIQMYELFKSSKIKSIIIHLFTLSLTGVTIFLTTSRGAYLGVIAFLIIFVIGFIKFVKIDYKKHKKLVISTLITLFIILIPVVIFGIQFMSKFMENSTFLNGREEDWSDAIKYFLEYPIFGKSWYSDTWEIHSFRSYHNTFLHTLATMGLFGLFALIYHHVELVRLFIKKWSLESFIVISMLVITHVHGLVDNTYYAPMHMIPLLILYVSLENHQKENLLT